MWTRNKWALGSMAMYAMYLHAGLLLWILALFNPSDTLTMLRKVPTVSWTQSIVILASGNLFHSFAFFGPKFTTAFLVYSMAVVIAMEELGLHTGFPFGEYHFTNALGPKMFQNLPFLVPVLWYCLIYPCLILGYQLVLPFGVQTLFTLKAGKPNLFRHRYWLLVCFVSASFLTGFDFVSEPVAIRYGHQVWKHYAYVDNKLTTYMKMPDWVFEMKNNSGIYLFDVPLLNYVGWMITALAIYLPTVYIQLQPTRFGLGAFSPPPQEKGSLGYYFPVFPVIVALVCTQLFYAMHPAHPVSVHLFGTTYVSVTLSIMFLTSYFKK